MSTNHDLLFEIGTEELPPKALLPLAQALLDNIEAGCEKQKLAYESTQYFAAPRRIAVLLKGLQHRQEDYQVIRKGPQLKAAFDKDGKPTPACLGFANTCGVRTPQLKPTTFLHFQQIGNNSLYRDQAFLLCGNERRDGIH